MRMRLGRRMKRLGCLSSRGLGLADQGPGNYTPCSFQAGPFPVPAVMSEGFHQPCCCSLREHLWLPGGVLRLLGSESEGISTWTQGFIGRGPQGLFCDCGSHLA